MLIGSIQTDVFRATISKIERNLEKARRLKLALIFTCSGSRQKYYLCKLQLHQDHSDDDPYCCMQLCETMWDIPMYGIVLNKLCFLLKQRFAVNIFDTGVKLVLTGWLRTCQHPQKVSF